MRDMTKTLAILTALADPTRYQALRILWDGHEHCACELVGMLDKSQPMISRHMSMLKRTGLVVDRREAQWVRYRRNPDLTPAMIAMVQAVFDLEKPPRKKKK